MTTFIKSSQEESKNNCYTPSKSSKNGRVILKLKKINLKNKLPNQNESKKQIDVTQIKEDNISYKIYEIPNKPIEIENDEKEISKNTTNTKQPIQIEENLDEVILKISSNYQPFQSSPNEQKRIEQEVIENFDLSLITADNISSPYKYQQIYNSLKESSATFQDNSINNNKLDRNLWTMPMVIIGNTCGICRRCSKPVLDDNDKYTIECVCSNTPMYHKICVQLAGEATEITGLQFTCPDCSTPIPNVYDSE